MVSVAEAWAIVLQHLWKPSVIELPIELAVNRIIAEQANADRDLPPANRVTMDGIAIDHDAWTKGVLKFPIEATQAAGMEPTSLKQSQHAIEVMTGAVLPEGTNTVIPYEELQIEDRVADIKSKSVTKGQNIHSKGADAKHNDVLITEGTRLSAAEIALLASVGKTHVKVFAFPRTAIISSGDELVEVATVPAIHQVRLSNSYAINAAMKQVGWEGVRFHIADDKEAMTIALKKIASEFDVLILSGGVSKGKFDFVPAVMEEIGIHKKFHRVNQKPGKPFWFGISDRSKVVFALPGNPVSTYMCFYRYILPWIRISMQSELSESWALLAEDYKPPRDMTYFLQVRVANERGTLVAYPETGGGSGDFANLKRVTGFLELPPTGSSYKKGEAFFYLPFRAEL